MGTKKQTLPKKALRVGVVQMQSGDDVAANVAAALGAVERLGQRGCDLICLPENTLYLRLSKIQSKTEKLAGIFDLSEKFWAQFAAAAKTHQMNILLGSVALKGIAEKPASTTLWVKPSGDFEPVYEKIHMFDVDVKGAPPVRESDFFVRGKGPRVIEIGDWRVGLSICYDVRFAELYSFYAKDDVHLIVVPSAFLVPTGQAHWHILLRARAIESQAFVVAAAQSGEHKGAHGSARQTFGHSLVVGPWGEVLVELTEPGPDEKIISLEPALLEKVRAQIPMADHRNL